MRRIAKLASLALAARLLYSAFDFAFKLAADVIKAADEVHESGQQVEAARRDIYDALRRAEVNQAGFREELAEAGLLRHSA